MKKESFPRPDQENLRLKKYVDNKFKRFTSGVIYRGVVVENVDPDKLNRVRVKIEGLSPSSSPKGITKWAWTMSIFGGGQESGIPYGACFVPQIGSKVFVAFEPGDTLENPVVLGGWYQSDRVPEQQYDRKETDPEKPTPRAYGYVSPKGHSILCREEDDEEAIELISQGGRKIIISDKKDQELITLVGKKGGEITLKEGKEGTVIRLSDPKGNGISIDEENENIVISCAGTIILNAKDVSVNAENTTNILSKKASILASDSFLGIGVKKTYIGADTSTTNIEGLNLSISSMTTIDITALTAISVFATTTIDILTSTAVTITATTIDIIGILNSLP